MEKTTRISNYFLSEAAEQLQRGSAVRLRVDGSSMTPFIRGGRDLIVVVPYAGEPLLPYCALFYRWEGQYMIHRLVGREVSADGQEVLCLMGDGNLVRIERIRRDEVLGVLQQIVRPNGTVVNALGTRWRRMGRCWFHLLGLRKIVARAKSAASRLGRQHR